MAQHDVPGLSIAIAKDDRLVYATGFGLADREPEEPVTVRSRFRIASVW
jgi:CubicO group peptidase (beta-lactamase class C family)